jgi:hypothetical protein
MLEKKIIFLIMNLRSIIIGFYLFFFIFFPVKSYFDVEKLNQLDKIIFYSSNSLLIQNELKTEQCIDGNILTSCKEICKESFSNSMSYKNNFLYLNKGECGFVWQISPSHIMYKFPPEKNQLFRFGIYLSEEDHKNRIPKRIRLILYQQQLYHINKDYRFPDQPVYTHEIILNLEKKIGWQFWNLQAFNEYIKVSNGFPENIKQRWLKIIIEDTYNKDKDYLSISEFYYQDQFFNTKDAKQYD